MNCDNLLTDDILEHICAHCKQISILRSRKNQSLTRSSIELISASTFSTLKELSISYCYNVDMLVQLKHCTLLEKLEILDISYTHCNPEDRLDELLASLTQLRVLLMYGKEVKSAALYAIAHHCPHIESTYLDGCTGDFSGEGLLELVACARNLRYFSVTLSFTVENSALAAQLSQLNPGVEVNCY